MTLNEARKLYPSAAEYADEIGRFVSKSGATYRAWHNGQCHLIDPDADSRKYGEEGEEFGCWTTLDNPGVETMKRFEIVRWNDDAVGTGFRLYYRGDLVGTAGNIAMLRRWARSLWTNDLLQPLRLQQYEKFLDWCCNNGWTFPCEATHFFNRATAFAAATNADAADDHAMINALCRQGIGPDWRNDD